MDKIVALFNKHEPIHEEFLLRLDDVEFLSATTDDPLFFYSSDDDCKLEFKSTDETLGHGIYMSDTIKVKGNINKTLFTVIGCKILGNHDRIFNEGYDYCITDEQQIIPYCIIYMSLRDY